MTAVPGGAAPSPRRSRSLRRTALLAVLVVLGSLLLGTGTASAQTTFVVQGGLVRYDVNLPEQVVVDGVSTGHAGDPVTVLLDGAQVADGSTAADGRFTVPFTLAAADPGRRYCGTAPSVDLGLSVVLGRERSPVQTLTVRCPTDYLLQSTTDLDPGGLSNGGGGPQLNLYFSSPSYRPSFSRACLAAVQDRQAVGAVQGHPGGPPAAAFQVLASPARAGRPTPDLTPTEVTLRGDGCYDVPLPETATSYVGRLVVQAELDPSVVPDGTAGVTLTSVPVPLQRAELVSAAPQCRPVDSSDDQADLDLSGSRWPSFASVQVFEVTSGSPEPVGDTVQVDDGRWQATVTIDRQSATDRSFTAYQVRGGEIVPSDPQVVTLAAPDCAPVQETVSFTVGTRGDTSALPRTTVPAPGGQQLHRVRGRVTANIVGAAVLDATIDGVPATFVDPQTHAVVDPAVTDDSGTFDYLLVGTADTTCGTHLVDIGFLGVRFSGGSSTVPQAASGDGFRQYETVCPVLALSPGLPVAGEFLRPMRVSGTGWNDPYELARPLRLTLTDPDGAVTDLGTVAPATFRRDADNGATGSFTTPRYVPRSACGTGWTVTARQVDDLSYVRDPSGQGVATVLPDPAYAPQASTVYQVACTGQATVLPLTPQSGRSSVANATVLLVSGFAADQHVTVSYDGVEVPSDGVIAPYDGQSDLVDADGVRSVTAYAPTGDCGNHVWTVTPTSNGTQRTPVPGASPSTSLRPGPARVVQEPRTDGPLQAPRAAGLPSTAAPDPRSSPDSDLPVDSTYPASAAVTVTCQSGAISPAVVSSDDEPTTVSYSGTGFTPKAVVTVGGSTGLVDELGSVTVTQIGVRGLPCGPQAFPVTEQRAGTSEVPSSTTTAVLSVTCPAPATVALSPSSFAYTSGSRGGVQLTGLGWRPDSGLQVFVDGTEVFFGGDSGLRSDGAGAFDTPLPVPAGLAPGQHTVSVTGLNRTAVATVLTVTRPTLTLSDTALSSDAFPATVTVSGSGFDPGYPVTVVLPLRGATTVGPAGPAGCGATPRGASCTAVPQSTGAFSFTVDPRTLACGTGQTGAATESGDVFGNAPPTASTVYSVACPDPPVVTAVPPRVAQSPGTRTVAVTGTGFRPDTVVTVRLDGSGAAVTTRSDGAGRLPAATSGTPALLPLTDPTCGVHPVSAQPAAGFPAATSVLVTCPTLTPSVAGFPETSPPGQVVVSGSGFDPGSVVDVTDPAGNLAPVAVTAADDGSFTARFAGSRFVCGPAVVTAVQRLTPGQAFTAPSATTTVTEQCASTVSVRTQDLAAAPAAGGAFARDVRGRVLDADGAAVPGARLTFTVDGQVAVVALPRQVAAGSLSTPDDLAVVTGRDGSYAFQVVSPRDSACGVHTLVVTAAYQRAGDPQARTGSTPYTTVCPTLVVDPATTTADPALVAVTLTGTGFDRGPLVPNGPQPVRLTLASAPAGQAAPSLDPVTDDVLTVVADRRGVAGFTVTRLVPRSQCGTTWTVTAVQDNATPAVDGGTFAADGAYYADGAGLPSPAATPRATASYTVACSPTLVVSPEVLQDGQLLTADAAGYLPSSVVTFTWLLADGTAGLGGATCTTDTLGACRTTVLVLPHDRRGDRMLVGTDTSGSTAQAAALVVASTVQPGRRPLATQNRNRLLQRR